MDPHPDTATGRSSGAPSTTSTGLLDRVKAREVEAWQRLVDLYAPLFYDWCRQYGLHAEDSADVGQEVFAAVATGVAEFRRDQPGHTFRGWLWTVTHSKIADHFRRLHGQVQAAGGTDAQQQLAQIADDPADSSTSPPSGGIGEVAQRVVQLVRPTVEERTWRAFWAITVDGRPAADVAQELGMSVPAVYKAKYRVIRQIRRELG